MAATPVGVNNPGICCTCYSKMSSSIVKYQVKCSLVNYGTSVSLNWHNRFLCCLILDVTLIVLMYRTFVAV